jgi:hypothetical protein
MLSLSVSRYPDLEEDSGMPDDSVTGGGYEGRVLIMFNH